VILWCRYWFGDYTIIEAKEDSLLLPAELVHDVERRCDSSRRHVNIQLLHAQMVHFSKNAFNRHHRYKHDGSDVLGLLNYYERTKYLHNQVYTAKCFVCLLCVSLSVFLCACDV